MTMRLLPQPPKVFISYRRTPALNLASRIRLTLENYGLDVYQDYTDLEKGQFEQQLMEAVRARIFLPILTPNTLNRCRENSDANAPFDNNDFVLKEYNQACRHHCTCIPLFTQDFDFADVEKFLPVETAAYIKGLQSVKLDQVGLFDASVDQCLRYIEPRPWVRRLWRPIVRKTVFFVLACLVVLFVSGSARLAYWLYDRSIHPPAIELTNPTNKVTSVGWNPDIIIRDMAISSTNVWQATDSGLRVYRIDQDRFEMIPDVPYDLYRVATGEEGRLVWFVLSYPEQGPALVGFYDDVGELTTFLNPAINGQVVDDVVLSLAVSDDEQFAWLGTNTQGIFQYSIADKKWSQIVVQTSDEDVDVAIPVNVLRIYPQADYWQFWATNYSSIYWGANRADQEWLYMNNSSAGDNGIEYIWDIAVDAYGHLWIAHENGVIVLFETIPIGNGDFPEWIECTPKNSDLVSIPIFAISPSDDGKFVWLVSKNGVNIVETPTVRTECDRLQWYFWDATQSDDLFWDFSSRSEQDLRVAAESGDSGRAWVFQQNDHEIRVFDLSP